MDKPRKPWGFCATPEEKCTMSYCNTNGCMTRVRNKTSTPVDAEMDKAVNVEDLLQKDYHRFTFEDLLAFGNFVLSEDRLRRRFEERMAEGDYVDLKNVHVATEKDITEFFNEKRKG